ncbi:hypothetical protein EVA_20232 [gut metagenome]|uniref:Uncharacterized protein n=1 Tax=gut metagenome TaxID=749906 RepID=J9F9S8_9ZZZZ
MFLLYLGNIFPVNVRYLTARLGCLLPIMWKKYII